jgi:IS5 family transposase
MKAHIGVDAQSGLVHSVTGTAANVADIAQTHALLHGQEKAAYADAGYLGVEKREEIATRSPGVEGYVAAKRGKVKALAEGLLKELTVQCERLKAQVRARVDTLFTSSRTSSGTARRATVDWPGTPPICIASSLRPTSSSPDARC